VFIKTGRTTSSSSGPIDLNTGMPRSAVAIIFLNTVRSGDTGLGGNYDCQPGDNKGIFINFHNIPKL
jgi:hypothetical protein